MSPFQERRQGTEVGTRLVAGVQTPVELLRRLMREKLDNKEDHVVTESDSSLSPVSSSSDTED